MLLHVMFRMRNWLLPVRDRRFGIFLRHSYDHIEAEYELFHLVILLGNMLLAPVYHVKNWHVQSALFTKECTIH